METIEHYANPLARLYHWQTHQEKLANVHEVLRERCAGIDRIAVALYDAETRILKTFLASPARESPLVNYQAALDEGSSLTEVAEAAHTRVIHDLSVLRGNEKRHARLICGHGYASSYTCPMFLRGELTGFIFFDSLHKHYFRDQVREQVEIYAHLVTEMIMNDLASMRALVAALRTAIGMIHMRDPETGSHLERMARYCRLIARELVETELAELDDEQIEQIFQFAPLHDVGKVGIPDHILQKPGRLEPAERAIMDTHPAIGRQVVDDLIDNFGFDRLPYIDYLRNIVEQHHETMDGQGYPQGLAGREIALEARIVAVSDVFDALTTSRPYKKAWSNEQAFSMLRLLALDKLDGDCVAALLACPEEILDIQARFQDN